MRLQQLVDEQRLQLQPPAAREIADLWRVAADSTTDSRVSAISLDLRFSAAYDAALTLATIALRCAGYRTRGAGHHATVFAALPDLMGPEVQPWADLFEACRIIRNTSHYRRRGQVTPTQLVELGQATEEFRAALVAWLEEHYPDHGPAALD